MSSKRVETLLDELQNLGISRARAAVKRLGIKL